MLWGTSLEFVTICVAEMVRGQNQGLPLWLQPYCGNWASEDHKSTKRRNHNWVRSSKEKIQGTMGLAGLKKTKTHKRQLITELVQFWCFPRRSWLDTACFSKCSVWAAGWFKGWLGKNPISIFTLKLDYICFLLRTLSWIVKIILGGIKDTDRIRLVCKRFRVRYNYSQYQFYHLASVSLMLSVFGIKKSSSQVQ